MRQIVENPFAIFVLVVLVQCGAALFGDRLRRRVRPLKKDEQNDLDTVLAATLTLLALIIGFSFSMAVSRYDQRKNYEEAEANAIGTEYMRADLLPTEDAEKIRQLLRSYLNQRIAFYSGGEHANREASAETAKVRDELWSRVVHAASVQPSPVLALTVSGMNEIFNAQTDTQAAWLNRIPVAAWALMVLIAIFANLLLGYRERSSGRLALIVLPVIASIAFFLIADIDSPNVGVISVAPHNLVLTSEAMKAHP
jgi:hypothetical protein